MSVYSHPIPVNISITVGQLLNGKFAIGQRIIPQITITEIIEIFPPEHRTSPVSDMDHNKPQLCQSLISIIIHRKSLGYLILLRPRININNQGIFAGRIHIKGGIHHAIQISYSVS